VPSTQELLDPESWGKVLEVYAQTVNMGVALVDHDGRLIGRCHNAKPIWTLARAARPDWGEGCLFCLNSDSPSGRDSCTAAADAQRTGALAIATDTAGFVHVAVPLSLGERYLGTLLAGQAFDRYPELLNLEKAAKQFGSRANLMVYGTLLDTLSHAFLRERYSTILKRELEAANERLKIANLDMTEKVAELAQSNSQKDVLLNEVHHRVNNNLQVISSLLRMQAEAFPDEQVAIALRASMFRVESMALIHSQLYNSEDWQAVDFAEYATSLGANLLRSYGVEETRIILRVEIEHFDLSVDKAIPAGLILNELISNALKHAFPGNRAGSIVIKGRLIDGSIELSVEDDGAGIQESAEPKKRQSLGHKIIKILCRQLKGTFVQPGAADVPARGSIFRLSFPYESGLRKPPV
jgi:two-component sensor histidine kinase/ligand-binding sensor protein